ncbi:glycosyl hydrolase 5 family protein-like [Abrus precatorius]|uniref:Glycosyl hydrolase 5 family protein-like n=1 Tax=Abrus precatorius TaxID=3816 RepID=A0A8B8K2Y7_ABRPR|nr:glycosyl hydrolase 5 family protein-like [Abrus precatorius]
MLGTTTQSIFVLLFVFICTYFSSHSNAYPLSTHSRWIMDDSTGQRAKLVCGNWAGHLKPMIPEGLDRRPLKDLVTELVEHRFNCVRLTYAIYMWTRYGHDNVIDTFASLDAPEVIDGIAKNNPSVLSMTHIQAFDAVVHELGVQNVRVLLDNHVSEPKWCCNDDDQNGFFHDRHFDPQEWVHGLTLAAKHFNGNHAVVAMSLRNELHGPRQNLNDWYKYMSQGALAIHKANPNVLVVISGLNYDTELEFLRNRPLKIDLGKKMVFETHLYSWSGIGTLKLKEIWTKQPLNRICANSIKGLDYRVGFLTIGKNATPLIFTEFGFDQTGSSVEDNRFLTCLQTYLAGRDLDWGLWAFQGDYYVRGDKIQVEESFGVMDATWDHLRDPNFTDKFQLIQRKNQDPTSKVPIAYILYHPLSGQCAQVNDKNELEVGSCDNQNRWIYGGNGSQILLQGSKKCLTASSEGLPVAVSDDCQSKNSSWKSVSLSKLHLATMDQDGEQICLQKNSNSSIIVTSKCICIEDDSLCLNDPQSQWFQLVPTNV